MTINININIRYRKQSADDYAALPSGGSEMTESMHF